MIYLKSSFISGRYYTDIKVMTIILREISL